MRTLFRGLIALLLLSVLFGSYPVLLDAADLRLRVVVEKATIRSQPDIGSEVLESDVPVGTLLNAEKKVGDWYQIRHRSSLGMEFTGYIHSMYVEEIQAEEPVVPPPVERKPQIEKREPEPQEFVEPRGYGRASQKGRLSFFFSGGMSLVNPTDFNDMVDGYAEIWSDSNDYFDWGSLKSMLEISGEMTLHFSDSLAVGLGAGYIFKSSPASFGTPGISYTRDYQFSVIPLTGTLYLNFPLNTKLEMMILGGAGFYLGKIKHDYYYSGSSSTTAFVEDVKSNVPGFHFGAGLEFRLSPGFALVMTGIYRLVNFNEWTGTETWGSNVYEGELYYVEYYGSPRLWVFDGPPSSSSYRNVGLAEINLSGLVLRIGFRLYL